MRKGRGAKANRRRRTCATIIGAVFLAVACGETQNDSEDGDEAGDAGAPMGFGGSRQGGASGTATGGKPTRGGTGGVVAIGGTGATGGVVAIGGTGATGGVVAIGGTGTGGDTGGVAGQGGGNSGGSTGSGGASGAGGTAGGKGGSAGSVAGFGGGSFGGAGSGGKAGASGSGGSAGSGVTCDLAFTVSADGFVRAPGALGCWHGYAFTGCDVGSVVTPTSFAMCGTGCVLRTRGTLGPATAANAYAGAVFLGFNLNQATGSATAGTVTPRGTSLVVTYLKTSGPAVLRAQLQAGATRWCAILTGSPATIAYATFNTACWDSSGTSYAKQPVDQFLIFAPGEATSVPIDVTLVSIEDR
jgi:hypothetical protein